MMETDADRGRDPARLQALAREAYGRLAAPLRALEMNTLFARAVVEQDAPGWAAAYPGASPAVGYVVHGYGMSLLFGDGGDPAVNDALAAQVVAMPRERDEWLQVSTDDWAAMLAERAGVERHTRVNFRFAAETYRARRPRFSDPTQRVVRVGRAAFEMPGAVVPRAFFRDVEAFLRAGTAFAVVVDDAPVALAFSSFATSAALELGIETLAPYRGRGLATLACAALIDDCLARGLEPVWACRLENTASYRLARTLGFEPVRELPYFRLAAG